MTKFRRLLTMAAVATTACGVVASQVGGLSLASATSAARDGGAVGAVANKDLSQTPIQVRNHTAKVVGRLSSAQHLRVSLGIKPRDLAGAEQFNQAVQNPSSALFHHYLSAAEWNARYAPTAADEQAVVDWATANGLTVSHRYPNRLLVDVDATASALESALHVTLNRYSLDGKTVFSNAAEPVLPSSIKAIVTSVDGLNDIAALSTSSPASAPTKTYSPGPVVQPGTSGHANGSRAKLEAARAKNKGNIPAITSGWYDPTDIYSSQMYDQEPLHKQSSCCNPTHNPDTSPPETSIAIPTVGAHLLSDMQSFQGRYSYLAFAYNESYIDGTPACCDNEGQMDLEWATALANSFGSFQDTAHIYLYSGVNNLLTTFNDMYNQILTDGHAKIVSSSWGCAEIYCTTDATMNTDHAIFDAMIGQGYTLVNDSDDKGAFSDCSHRSVQYPASDSDFLAISATNLELSSGGSYVSETAWPANSAGCANNGGGGGGGCSAKFAIPSWQTGTSSLCPSSKAVPDVSLNGDWFNSPQNVFFNGAWQGNGGTSIATPEFAGFIAEENSYLRTLGSICGLGAGNVSCAPIGQAGSNLYGAAQSHGAGGINPFYDITSGCTTNDIGSGYCGIVGYDRATGWGTVNMLQLAWAMSYRTVAEGTPPSVAISGPPTGTYLNGGTLTWTVADSGGSFPASGVAGWTALWDVDPGNPTSHATPGAGDSFYSGPSSSHGSTSGSTLLSGVGAGCHTLFVRAWDNIGDSGVSSYGPVCYDGTAPVVTAAPKASLVANTSVTASGVPVKISWAATDATSGVQSYHLDKSVDGGAFATVAAALTTTSKTVTLAPGHAYQFRVSATDKANNTSAHTKGPTFHLNLIQETAGSIEYSSGWTRVARTGASGGFVKDATAAGKKATFTFSGKYVAWVTTKAAADGDAKVALDGNASTVVHTNGTPTAAGRILYVKAVGAGSHKLAVTVVGTSGHPRVDVDAFVVIS